MSVTARRTLVLGYEAVVLENSNVRAVVIPSLGGRVWELEDRIHGRQWIWQRDDVTLAAAERGASYDDVWAGGWEELFPNDAPSRFEGRDLPDHGEWWTQAWSVAELTDGAEAVLRIEATTQVRAARCTKEFRLGADDDTLHVSYRIESLETEAFHFLFKQHLPIALTPECRLVLPGGTVTAVDPSFGTLIRSSESFAWPRDETQRATAADLRQVPPRSSGHRDFVYVDALPAGWCGVDDVARQASLRMHFDLRHMPFLWLFLTYGGWRDCYTAVLEPCSNMPKDLTQAVRAGRSAHLAPGTVFETRVAVSLSALGGTA